MEKDNQNSILQRARGVRDFLPQFKIARDKIIKKIIDVFEQYGYNPLETPIIERYELFSSKFGQGEESEAMRESFVLTDRGGRQLILRNEFTVPFARVVGMNPNLNMPFKRYQIGQIYRDGPIKLGRYREFWQCDVDVVGLPSGAIDAEIINLTLTVFKNLGLEVEVKINNRKILNAILAEAKITTNDFISTIISIDKFDKIGAEGVKKELTEKNISIESINKILDLLNIRGQDNQETINLLSEKIQDLAGLNELKETLAYVTNQNNVSFCPNLARGLAYYTGNVFEVYLTDTTKINSSLAGGGRYDEMIPGFLKTKKEYPCVGISFGLETIFDALNVEKEIKQKTITDIYLVPLGQKNLQPALLIAEKLRSKNFRVDLDYLLRSPSKALTYANNLGIKIVLLLGDDEIKNKSIAVKIMSSGEQKIIEQNNLEKFLKENL